MAPLDSASMLPDISADQPAGENLEYDADFIEFERLALGKPEQQYGATVVPAEDPDWRDLVARGRTLLERTYDLRVLSQLAVARLYQEGVPGYADALGLIRQVLETRWEPVHPQLDPEDDNDPTLRANALLLVGNAGRVQKYLRGTPLARSPRAGPVSWRDIAVANGTIEPDEGATKLSDSVINGAFRDTSPAQLTALRDGLVAAAAHIAAIPAAFEAAAGYGTGPDYGDAAKLLRDMLRMVDQYAAAEAPAEEEPIGETAEAGGDVADAPAPRVRGAVTAASLGPVTNRTDAQRLLELVVGYYEQYEPSSPLPLLIGRARRLSEMNFLDLLRDLAPDGLNQAERVVGTTEN